MSDSADQPGKTPAAQAIDQALDVLVYAPIGLLFEGASLLPTLVERGKSHVTTARMVGKFAVTSGRGEATKAATKLQDQVADLLYRVAEVKLPGAGRDGATPATEAPAGPAAVADDVPVDEPPAPSGPAIDVDALAIPDYDGLSASHVVNRLAGLSADELEMVRLYEAANRGRKTILSKIAQLQSS